MKGLIMKTIEIKRVNVGIIGHLLGDNFSPSPDLRG
jgi:hypothetical protein